MRQYILTILLFSSSFFYAQTIYKCFDSDANKKLKISIKFVNDKAISVKYYGQKSAIPLVFEKEIYNKGTAYPTINEVYQEKYNGQITGKYKITHSGNWDYVEYTRKDGKIFKFTVNHDTSLVDENYRETPCF